MCFVGHHPTRRIQAMLVNIRNVKHKIVFASDGLHGYRTTYRKIPIISPPKISPPKNKPPKSQTQNILPIISPPKYKPTDCYC